MIYLLIGVVIVLLIVGFAVSSTTFAKQDTAIRVTSNDTLYDGDYFSISLTDVNGTPLTNHVVNITIIDANGAENHQQVTTDGSGNGKLQLNGLTPGEYTFNVTYGGNDSYNGCNITQKITMAKKVVEEKNNNQQDSYVYSEQPSTSDVSNRNPDYLKKDSNGNVVYTQAENGYWYATTESGRLKGAGFDSPIG